MRGVSRSAAMEMIQYQVDYNSRPTVQNVLLNIFLHVGDASYRDTFKESSLHVLLRFLHSIGLLQLTQRVPEFHQRNL